MLRKDFLLHSIYLEKTLWIVMYVLTGFNPFSVLLLFFHHSSSLASCMVFDAISSNIYDVLLINPSTYVFVIGELILTCSSGTVRPGELFYNFSQVTLLRWLTFLLGFLTVTLAFLDCDSRSPALLDLFFLFMLLFGLQWLSLHWEILIMLLSQSPLTFCQTQRGMLCFTA